MQDAGDNPHSGSSFTSNNRRQHHCQTTNMVEHARLSLLLLMGLQAELLQQATVNRPRLLGVLAKAAADAPARQAEAEKAMQSEEYVRAYMLVDNLPPFLF